jgi:hypothetical protein
MKEPDLDLLIPADFTAHLGVGTSASLWEYQTFRCFDASNSRSTDSGPATETAKTGKSLIIKW